MEKYGLKVLPIRGVDLNSPYPFMLKAKLFFQVGSQNFRNNRLSEPDLNTQWPYFYFNGRMI